MGASAAKQLPEEIFEPYRASENQEQAEAKSTSPETAGTEVFEAGSLQEKIIEVNSRFKKQGRNLKIFLINQGVFMSVLLSGIWIDQAAPDSPLDSIHGGVQLAASLANLGFIFWHIRSSDRYNKWARQVDTEFNEQLLKEYGYTLKHQASWFARGKKAKAVSKDGEEVALTLESLEPFVMSETSAIVKKVEPLEYQASRTTDSLMGSSTED